MTKVNLRTLIVYVVWLFPWKGIAIVYKIKKILDWGAIKNLKERQLVRYADYATRKLVYEEKLAFLYYFFLGRILLKVRARYIFGE